MSVKLLTQLDISNKNTQRYMTSHI